MSDGGEVMLLNSEANIKPTFVNGFFKVTLENDVRVGSGIQCHFK